jgi:hypothetical protein
LSKPSQIFTQVCSNRSDQHNQAKCPASDRLAGLVQSRMQAAPYGGQARSSGELDITEATLAFPIAPPRSALTCPAGELDYNDTHYRLAITGPGAAAVPMSRGQVKPDLPVCRRARRGEPDEVSGP